MTNLIKLEEPYTVSEGDLWIERCRKHQEAGGIINCACIHSGQPFDFHALPDSYTIVQPEQGEPEWKPVNGWRLLEADKEKCKKGDTFITFDGSFSYVGKSRFGRIVKRDWGATYRQISSYTDVKYVAKLTDSEKLEKIRNIDRRNHCVGSSYNTLFDQIQEIVGGEGS